MSVNAWEMIFAGVFCVFLALVQVSLGCSPIPNAKPDSMEKRFYHSDNVVYGRIIAHFEEAKPMYDTVYTAEMEVYCTFKGDQLPKKINISDAGFVPGLCHSTNLTRDHNFTVFLDYVNKRYTPIYKEDPVSDQYLEEISLICEHNIQYPRGVDENTAKVTCPENYQEYEGCLSYTEPPPSANDKEIQVKPLTNGPPIVAVAEDPKPSTNDDNGSDIISASCVLYMCLLVYSMLL